MKSKYLIILLIQTFLFIALSCEKDDFTEKEYDCKETVSSYDSNDNLIRWYNYYYKNGNKIKYETYDDRIYTYEYDEYGNVISMRGINSEGEEEMKNYTYDTYGNLIRTENYTSDQLSSYDEYTYSGNQKVYFYAINSLGDTIGCAHYFYENDLISHVEYDWYNDYYYRSEYYYYSNGLDSTLTYKKDGRMIAKTYYDFLDEKMVYMESFTYDSNNEVYSHGIFTREYYNQLKIRETKKYEDKNGRTEYHDYSYEYNEDDLISKFESYDELGNIIEYVTYQYDILGLKMKVERFNQNGILTGYSTTESTCN